MTGPAVQADGGGTTISKCGADHALGAVRRGAAIENEQKTAHVQRSHGADLVVVVRGEIENQRAGIKPGDLLLRIGELDPAIVQMEALKPLVGEVGREVLVRWRSNMEIREARLVYGESEAR